MKVRISNESRAVVVPLEINFLDDDWKKIWKCCYHCALGWKSFVLCSVTLNDHKGVKLFNENGRSECVAIV